MAKLNIVEKSLKLTIILKRKLLLNKTMFVPNFENVLFYLIFITGFCYFAKYANSGETLKVDSPSQPESINMVTGELLDALIDARIKRRRKSKTDFERNIRGIFT